LPKSLQLVFGWRLIIRISFNLSEAAMEIHFGSGDYWRALPPFGSYVEDREEYKRKIVRHEGRRVPVILQEHGPTAKLSKAK
jgi:hypothetical protein